MVSSESKKVLDIAEEYGAEVPFVRPDHLARDPYGVSDVCLNVLEAYEQLGQTFDTLIILLPTSPFRTAEDIDAAYALFRENNANYLMSVSEYEHSPYSALRMASQFPHQAFPCFPETLGKKRHEMPVPYRANGAICIVDVKAFKQSRSYYGTPLHVYAMPQSRSIDIDSALDFELAQWLLTKRVSND
ncbi:hypothetical protein DSM19430T_28030 [Desulfovibrio psychrotolerans]|uniref:Acylneuraminate cytidylyltransferase n=2 Tax=Desulfovibrio psychrotolerans TaxID=415242 RepID=A0A7J0BWM1_9BACT|nr:hypothetical protein DSM19430T_28030 [Desulfovibrio psychrotolerans]